MCRLDWIGLGAYCVWGAQYNLECVVEQVLNEYLDRITVVNIITNSKRVWAGEMNSPIRI